MNILDVPSMLESIYEDTGAVVDTHLNFYNREYLVYTLYPSIVINNDHDESLELNNFLFVSTFTVGYNKDTEEIFLNGLTGIRGYNLLPSYDMARSNYAHSHVSGLTSSVVCIGDGDGNILREMFNKMRNNRRHLEEEDVYTFFFCLNSLAHYENLDGGPYAYISTVNNEDLADDSHAELDEDSINDFINDQGTSSNDAETISFQWSQEVVNQIAKELSDTINLYNNTDDLESLNPDFKKGIERLDELCNKLTSEKRFVHDKMHFYATRIHDEYDLNYNNMLEVYKQFYCVFKHYYMEKFESNENITLLDCIEQYGKLLDAEENYFNFCVENIKVPFYRLWNSSDEEYSDQIFSESLLECVGDYATSNSNKYSDIEYSVNNLSFFIKNKMYIGKCPDLSKLQQTNFELHEHTTKVWAIENYGHMAFIIQDVVKQKQNRNEAITRDTCDFLESYSSSH